MRSIITIWIISLLLPAMSSAQRTEHYFDYNWKPCSPEQARFFRLLEKTDSGWLCKDYYLGTMKLQMQALFEDKDCKVLNGYYQYFHVNESLSAAGRKVHGRNEGFCSRYHSNGLMVDSAHYSNGELTGIRIQWHPNGYMADSINQLNDSMSVHVSWFDNASVSFAGYLLRGKPYGKWKFFHRSGIVASEERYDNGVVISKVLYEEDGSIRPDTTGGFREASFKKGGTDGWGKYLFKNSYWPPGLKIENTNSVTIGISFTINEEGKPEEVEVNVPFHPDFDKIAVRIIRESPAWIPAMDHNRQVKARFRQWITFQQDDQ